jgi:hypothetical protein
MAGGEGFDQLGTDRGPSPFNVKNQHGGHGETKLAR